MIIINIEGKTSIESALKTLKKKFSKCKIAKELNDRKTYKKKSEERRSVVKKAKFIESKRKGLE
jgi:ribosomal protein S21